ncbi:MAG: glycosyltransferase [Methylobacteriaceae bacterium]|nr:glycosyltransferase [Methylobacteriaceae bacterium]
MTWELAAAVFAIGTTAINVLSILIAIVRMKRRVGFLPPPKDAPPVTILRPVCGLEPFSEETLRSGFELDYPVYENVFGVARASDPIEPVVERLIAEHPHVPSRLIVGEERISGNPKLNNCVLPWNAASHDWVIMADSNLLMPRDYIQRLFVNWRRNTGLICSTPAGVRPKGFWAEVECVFLNSLQARWQYVGEALGFGFAQGKSMLWQKSFLEARGGIRALAAETAEDAAATKVVRRAGLHVHLVDAPFEQPLGRRTPREVWARQIRWARLRRVTFPVFFAPEIASGIAVPLALGLFAAAAYGVSLPLVAVAMMALWFGPEIVLARQQGWPLSWRMPFACLVRDALILPMWLYAWVAEDIVWRGNQMTIRTKSADDLSVDGALS